MNIKKYYAYQFMKELIPIYPIYALMFENKGLSIAQISLLLGIWSVPAIILEVPTGVLADRWSRKKLIILGKLLKGLCYGVWFFADSFWGFATGFLLWGTGSSFVSGTEEALLFDSLKLNRTEESFERVLGRGQFLSGISTLLASVTGGFLGMYFGFHSVLLLSGLSAVIAAAIALSFQEVNLYKDGLRQRESSGSLHTLKQSAGFVLKNKRVLMISLLSLLVILTAGVLDEYDQLIAKDYGLTVGLIGIWAAVRFLLMAFGSYIAGSLRKIIERATGIRDRMYTIGIMCLAAGGFLIASGLIRFLGVMILYGLYYLLMASCGVLQEDYVQQKISQEGRATVHSMISLTQNLCSIGFFGMIAAVTAGSDLLTGLVFVGFYIITATIVIGSVYYCLRRKKE